MRRGIRNPAVSVALLGGGVLVATFGLATMHFAVIAVGVLAILTGWLAAAGSAEDSHGGDADRSAPRRGA